MTRIIRDGGPWEDPVLQAVLKAQPASQEIGTSGDSKSKPTFVRSKRNLFLIRAVIVIFLYLLILNKSNVFSHEVCLNCYTNLAQE